MHSNINTTLTHISTQYQNKPPPEKPQPPPMAETTKPPPPPNLLHGKYELGRLLGHGNFAKVYHAHHHPTGQSVAIKVLSKDQLIKTNMTEQIKREISAMKKINHPNIVQLHEVMASKSKIYIAMEYVRGGELFDKISKGRLGEDTARVYFRQLISAVEFCHSRGVYHRDLKPENLLVDENGNLKVTDFGLSALSEHSKPDGLLHTRCGTPAYVAPEVIGKGGYDGAKADLWSCGVILFVLIAGYLPFQDQNVVAMYRKICRGDFKFPSWVSPESRRIVTRLLDPNPMSRITISELMETVWFKNIAPRQEHDVGEKDERKSSSSESLNAFHIISLSEGFDLSGLFEGRRRKEEELRFATARPASSVVARLEEVGRRAEFGVERSEGKVRLKGRERGRKGRLGVAAEMFPVTPEVMVVEVKKEGGDTLEYNQFCSEELRPALRDIIWSESSMTA